MARTLDLSALRSFVTVADAGGVTRAAGRLNLTQSAVSMQIKRLEEQIGSQLLDRSGRGVSLTGEGEQLLSYARRMIALNDEVWGRLTGPNWEGELTLGAPHDVVYPHIPGVLSRFARSHPRVRVSLNSSYTRNLKDLFARGEIDVILTTEDAPEAGGEVLRAGRMIWAGAPGGQAWRSRPLPLAFEHRCIFRSIAQGALDTAGIDWTMAVESESSRTIEATVSADLAVMTLIDDAMPPHMEPIAHDGALPPLPTMRICMYRGQGPKAAMIADLADAIREAYGAPAAAAA